MAAHAATAVDNDRHGEASGWLDELQRIVAAEALPASARLALIMIVDAFAAEDGYLAQPAARIRARLAATATPASRL